MKRLMLGGGGGRGCIEESKLLINWTLESFMETVEPISLHFFEDARDRHFFRAATCAEDGSVAILEYYCAVGYVTGDARSMFGNGGGSSPDRCRQEWTIVGG
jgi:hypothetical protein